MAWISVHEDVDGPKLRDFAKKADISKNEAVGTLVFLWLWGIKNADRSGLIKSADRSDVAGVISVGLSEGAEPICVVDAMVESGWIDEKNGCLFLHDWDEWQEMWYRYLSNKERESTRKRIARERERSTALPTPEPVAETVSEPKPKPSKPKTSKPAAPPKEKYAEFVSMTKEEYSKLVARYGEQATKKMIEMLDNYKGAHHKKYDSDYRAILSWVVDRVKEKSPGVIAQPVSQQLVDKNPFL